MHRVSIRTLMTVILVSAIGLAALSFDQETFVAAFPVPTREKSNDRSKSWIGFGSRHTNIDDRAFDGRRRNDVVCQPRNPVAADPPPVLRWDTGRSGRRAAPGALPGERG